MASIFTKTALLTAICFATVGGVASAQNINVVINGQPVSFSGTPPQELDGSVLVPLRGVFEQLGANVQYNPTTKTIFAENSSTSVSLALGSTTAYVNNQPEQLAQAPTVLLGTTLVPLRFVAEAFGAYVEWQPQTQTVQIQTSPSQATAAAPPPAQPEHFGNPPQPPPPPYQGPQPGHGPGDGNGDHPHAELQTVVGHVDDVDNPSNPSVLTLRTQSGSVQVSIDQHTRTVLKGQDPSLVAPIDEEIHKGDLLSARIWPNGTARSIELDYTADRGKVVGVQSLPGGSLIVVLDSGQIVQVDPDVQEFRHGQQVPVNLHRGDRVTMRLRPDGHHVYSVDVY